VFDVYLARIGRCSWTRIVPWVALTACVVRDASHCLPRYTWSPQWTAQQIVEAFPWDEAPRYLLRDRDAIYGEPFQQHVGNLGIEEVKITPRSPWQNPYCERVIDSIRRDMLDHVIVLNERHLTRQLTEYVSYYHWFRTNCHSTWIVRSPAPSSHPKRVR
jgi:hypothetical protein